MSVLDAQKRSPDISCTVALCTHNHAERLARTLRALAQLVPPSFAWELLIIDNASTDDTAQVVAASDWRTPAMNVRVVCEEELGLSNARNRAIRDATGDYIIFIDDDETPDPHWLTGYERVILEQLPDALGGKIEVMFEDGERPIWLRDELLGFLGKLDHGTKTRRLESLDTPIFGGNFGFRRELFARIGNFDAELGRKGSANIGGEDTEIYRRMITAGCSVWWVPDAVIYHRIQAGKLHRRYFLDLHFRQGRTEGMRKRGTASRIPPRYLLPQLWRAVTAALSMRLNQGSHASLRKEMNVAYFVGYLYGWAYAKDATK